MPTISAPEDVPAAFEAAWNSHDMRALAALFAEDANFVNVIGMWWKDRKEIEAAHAATHATIFRSSSLRFEAPAVTGVAPGVAAVHAKWDLTGQLNPDGSASGPRQGILLFVLVGDDRGWQVKVAQNTDIVTGILAPSVPS